MDCEERDYMPPMSRGHDPRFEPCPLMYLLAVLLLVLVNFVRKVVLLVIHLGLLLLGHPAAIGLAIRLDFLMDGRFLLLQPGRLTGAQLSASHAIRNPALLVF